MFVARLCFDTAHWRCPSYCASGESGTATKVRHSNKFKISLFSTQHIVHNFFAHAVLKRERAEDRADVGSFPIIYIMIYVHHYLLETIFSTDIMILFLQCYCKVANI